MIVRWSLAELPAVLAELGIERPLLVASPRWERLRRASARRAAGRRCPPTGSRCRRTPTGSSRVGGGSAIDTAKAASAATGLPLVSVPTTYSGAEWTPSFGVRTPDRRIVGGGGGARLAGIVYDVGLTLDLPRAETVGTALNALAHCAEALYVADRNEAERRARARGRGADRRAGCRGSSTRRTTARRGTGSCAARPRPARRSRSPGSGSRTRWRRRSAAPTACRTAR